MNSSRRQFLKCSVLTSGVAAMLGPKVMAAAKGGPGRAPAESSFILGRSRMRLGTVTFNLGRSWDVPTLIENCSAAGFEGVELRTTHAHGVEVSLNRQERAEVRKRFADSPVELASLGSAFEYHMPDAARLRKEIEDTKEYLVLAHDVGATGIKVRPNALPAGVPPERTLEQIGRSLGELARFAEDYGQQLRLEVHGAGTSLLPNIRRIIDVADHPLAGVCWNSNPNDLAGDGFDANFDLVKHKLFTVHLRDLYLENYPFRRLFVRLKEIDYDGYCFAEVPESTDPVRVMKYFRALWLAYQGLL